MKRFVSVMIAIMMVFSVMSFVVSAAGETVTLYVGSEESEAEVTGSSVDLEQTEDGVAATTTGGDPWISIALPDVDTSVYKFFTVTYRCNKEVGGNNTYMKTTNYIGAGDGGDWEPHGMGGTADGEWHSKEYSMEGFPTFADQEITGIRLTCCGDVDGVFEVSSIRFTTEHYEGAPVDESEYHYVNASFDSFFVNDVLNFGEADGGASDKLDARDRTVDGSDGSVSKFTLRGWIGFQEEIDSFGYQVNGNDPVYGDFKAATEDAVRGAGGQNALRFQVEIDATQLKGTNNIVIVVKLANGAVVKVDDTLQATGPATPPNSSFKFIGVEDSQPATSGGEEEIKNYLDEGTTQIGMSLDTIFWNGAAINDLGAGQIARTTLDSYLSEDGTLDAVKYGGKSIGYHGWVCFFQDVRQFGYMIGDKVVFDDSFAVQTDDGTISAVHSWGGDWAKGVVRRFTITIPIEELTGSNVVCAVAQLEDGQIIKLNDATAGNNRDTTVTIRSADPEPETNTQTGDMTVAMFAVIAVLAMGAAVVFMKKKAF